MKVSNNNFLAKLKILTSKRKARYSSNIAINTELFLNNNITY